MSSSRASVAACTGPLPPKASMASSRGSRPRSVETARRARAIVALATRCTPHAASSRRRLSGAAISELQRLYRELALNRQTAPGERRGIDEAEDDVGVGDGRHRSAAPVARRTRRGTGALRSDAQRAARVDPRHAAAAGANLGDVDGRGANVITAAAEQSPRDVDATADLERVHAQILARVDQRRLCGGAAHVEAEQAEIAETAGDFRRADHARRRPRFDDVDRPLGGGGGTHRASARLHDRQRLGDLALAQLGTEAAEIVLHQRQHVAIDDRRAGALVFAYLGQQLARNRHGNVRVALCGSGRGCALRARRWRRR